MMLQKKTTPFWKAQTFHFQIRTSTNLYIFIHKKVAMGIKGKKNREFLNVTFSADFANLQKKVSENHDLGV